MGLTIRDAIIRIENNINDEHSVNNKAIINIGATDIFNGIDRLDLFERFFHLIETCDLLNITPIITTIMPIAKVNNDIELIWKVFDFNEFLKKNFNDVIDLSAALSCGLSRSLATHIVS